MKHLIFALLVLGFVSTARGAAAGDMGAPYLVEVDLTTQTLCVPLTRDVAVELQPGDEVVFTWSAREQAPEVVTVDASGNRYPLFGDSGIYLVPGFYIVAPEVPEGTYYLGQIGGPVRGTVNVRRRR